MKIVLNFVLGSLLLYCNTGFTKSKLDSAGVYLTKEDFKQNRLAYSTPYRIKEKFGFLNSDFDYEAAGKLLLRQNNKVVSFEPGAIYGFYNKGYKYIFIPEVKKYLLVVNENPVLMLITESTTASWHHIRTTVHLNYLNYQHQLRELTDGNIRSDFGDSSDVISILENIRSKFKSINGSNQDMIDTITAYSNRQFAAH